LKGRFHETTIPLSPLLCALLLTLTGPLHAQTTTDAAKADGKAFGRDKAASAQSAATTNPDANRIPISAAHQASRAISTIPTG
jgi:hypothetical protein